MSLKNSKQFQQQPKILKQIEIFAPWKPDIVKFETPEEFNLYWNKNSEEFEGLSTYKLNLKYKIPGFKISIKTINNEKKLTLIKDYSIKENENENENEKTNTNKNELNLRILALEKQMKDITEAIIQIEKFLSPEN